MSVQCLLIVRYAILHWNRVGRAFVVHLLGRSNNDKDISMSWHDDILLSPLNSALFQTTLIQL